MAQHLHRFDSSMSCYLVSRLAHKFLEAAITAQDSVVCVPIDKGCSAGTSENVAAETTQASLHSTCAGKFNAVAIASKLYAR